MQSRDYTTFTPCMCGSALTAAIYCDVMPSISASHECNQDTTLGVKVQTDACPTQQTPEGFARKASAL